LIVGWCWFVGTLLPVIGLWQGGDQAWADRFSYWPHIGLFFVLVWSGAELAQRFRLSEKIALGAGVIVLCGLGTLTWVQVGYWKNPLALWNRALELDENTDRAHCQLGKYGLDHGELNEAEQHFARCVALRPNSASYLHFHGLSLLMLQRDDEAAVAFQESLKQAADHASAWQDLGVARLHQGRLQEAERCFRQVLSLQSDAADAHSALGRVLWRSGRHAEAVTEFQTALDLDNHDSEALNGLGVAYLADGQPDRAIEVFQKAERFQPKHVNPVNTLSNLGVALGRAGRWHEAAAYHRRALEKQDQIDEIRERLNSPTSAPEAVPLGVVFRCRLAFALNQLGDPEMAASQYRLASQRDRNWPCKFATEAWLLAVEGPVPDPQTANELIRQAIEGSPETTPALLDVLAATQAALGQFDTAAQTAQEALDKATASGDRTLIENVRNHLQLYRQGKAITANYQRSAIPKFTP
jgi:tetratricopeptide (TPR) repeat protein